MTQVSGQRRPTTSGTPLNTYVRQHIERVQTSIAKLLRPGHARAEALHDLHRDLRRLRVILAWRRKLNSSSDSATLDELALRLRRLTRLVGRVRDLDVELALWRSFRPGSRGPEVPAYHALATFGHRLQDDSRTGRELLKATLLAEVNAGFFDRVRVALQTMGSPASTRALSRAVAKERRRLADRAARLRRRALRDPDAERLHEFRVLIRRLRYLSDLEDHLNGRRGSTFPARYARVLRRLGDLHDRDVLAAHLDAVDPDHRAEEWSRRFRGEHRKLRKDLLKEMKELHPRRHLARGRPVPT
jgi:CHAD domain-containing protein